MLWSLRGGLNQASTRKGLPRRKSFRLGRRSVRTHYAYLAVCLFVCLLNTPLSRQVERG